MNVTLTGLTGNSNTFDADTVDPATGVVAMTAQQRRTQNVSRGTNITDSGGAVRQVQEDIEIVKTVLRAARAGTVAGIGNTTTSAPVGNQVLNAAGPTVGTFAALAPTAGSYLVRYHGVLQNTDPVNAGATIQAAVQGVGVGDQMAWPAVAVGGPWGVPNASAMDLGMLGTQVLVLAAGDSVSAMIGVTPGGVGGDDITVIGGGVSITKIS